MAINSTIQECQLCKVVLIEVDLWIHYKVSHSRIWRLTDENIFQCLLNCDGKTCDKEFARSQELKEHQDLEHSSMLREYFRVCVG